jgi:hypothetical protein
MYAFQWDLISSFRKAVLVFMLLVSSAYALDIDEKLTLRILKVSASKKTILINRGLEDGLVVGDHAKFYLTDGVIARGLVVKASPSRSVWSLYRIIRIEEIREQKVVNLKAATPVKVTNDPTKSLNVTPITGGGPERMVERSDGTIDLGKADKKDLDRMDGREIEAHHIYKEPVDTENVWEVFGLLGAQSLKITDNTYYATTTTDLSAAALGLGIERYFPGYDVDLARRFSFVMYANRSSYVNTANSVTSNIISIDVGAGSYYHFLNYPYATNRFSIYVGAAVGLGVESVTVETASTKTTDNGTANFFSGTLGLKYLMGNRVGFRGFVEYVQRGITFKAEGTSYVESRQTQKGIRIGVGAAYRF